MQVTVTSLFNGQFQQAGDPRPGHGHTLQGPDKLLMKRRTCASPHTPCPRGPHDSPPTLPPGASEEREKKRFRVTQAWLTPPAPSLPVGTALASEGHICSGTC